MSFQCPVCDSDYQKPIPQTCLVCGWDLQFHISIPEGLKQNQNHLDWAKQTWKYRQIVDIDQHKTPSKSKKRLTIADLLPRLESLENQLQQATQERQNLQNLLDWILHYLESINPELLVNITPPSAPNFPQSEIGLDYSSLIELLAQGDWKTADEYTWELMLYIAEREAEKWLRPEDIERFPCTDLNTINWL
ncbi:MAG: GUN4 domain-containing protein, partial [Planktothrix sp.]